MRFVQKLPPLCVDRPNPLVVGHAKQDDRRSRWFQAQMLAGDEPWTPPSGCTAQIRFRKADGHAGWYDTIDGGATAVTWSGATVTMGMRAQVMTAPGDAKIDVEFADATGILSIFSWTLRVEANTLDGADLSPSSDAFTILAGQVNQAQAAAQQVSDTAASIGARVSSPNLLDNWYFRAPINQRGLSSYPYSAQQYTIDRWKQGGLHGIVNVLSASAAVQITTDGSGEAYFNQLLPVNLPIGNTYTFSVLASAVEGTVYIRIRFSDDTFSPLETVGVGVTAVTVTADKQVSGVGLRLMSGASVSLRAAKLEIGGAQTLARSAGGGWLLNDARPDPTLERLKCRRYFSRYAGTNVHATGVASTAANVNFALPVAMAATPTASFSELSAAVSSSSKLAITAIEANQTAAGVWLMCSVSGATPGAAYSLRTDSGYLELSCEV